MQASVRILHLLKARVCCSSSNQIPVIISRYLKPKHLSTCEFLSDVTTSEGARYLKPGCARLSREDFVTQFLLSPTFRDIRRVIDNTDLVQEHWVQVSDKMTTFLVLDHY